MTVPGDDVLIVTEVDDVHGAALATTLERVHGIRPMTIDLRTFPGETGSFRLGSGGTTRSLPQHTSLDRVRAVWWRRPHRAKVLPGNRPDDDEFRQAECDSFVQGMLWTIPALWVNEPGAERRAARKLVQLERAARAGLAVPETLVTNAPDDAADFIASRPGKVIYKRTGTQRGEFSETRIVSDRALQRLASIRSSPTTFQDYIEPQADLRIVWIAGKELSVRIDSPAGLGRVDSRLDTSVDFAPCQLPASVSGALARMMHDLGLVFGVIDMRVGVDGKFYFLEVNPQGQFAYLEIKTGLPIFRTLADLLVGGAEPTPSSS